MTARRMALSGTGAVAVAVAALFAFVSQPQAAILAALISAVAGVAAAEIAVWAALRQPSATGPRDSRSPTEVSPGEVSNEISGTAHGNVVQARDVHGDVHFGRSA